MTYASCFSSLATARLRARPRNLGFQRRAGWRSSARAMTSVLSARPAAAIFDALASLPADPWHGRATPCPRARGVLNGHPLPARYQHLHLHRQHNPPAVRGGSSSSVLMRWLCPVVTLGELQHGAEKARPGTRRWVLQQLQAAIQVMPWHPLPVHITARSAPPWSAPGSPLATTTWDCRPCTRRGLGAATNNERNFVGCLAWRWRTGWLPLRRLV